MIELLQDMQNRMSTVSIYTGRSIIDILTKTFNRDFIANLPLASIFDGLVTGTSIPCKDPVVEIISGSLGKVLYMLMEIGGIIGILCIILGGLLRIASLTAQKKEDKDDRMFISKFFFICALIVLIPTFIFFVLVVLLPYWYGLGNQTCH
jgi:H+/gluconate symporter-like permease